MAVGTLVGGQQQLVFFPKDGTPPSPDARRDALNPDNPLSPYYGIVGNRKTIDRLIRIDFHALGQYNHNASTINVAILGGSGSGKTEIMTRHYRANRLPTAELGPKSVQKTHDVFLAIKRACHHQNIPMVQLGKENHYTAPPCNVVLDEVHAVNPNVIQGLLKATEPKDRTLHTEEGITLDCQYVHWIIGTTDRGKLPDAFDNRFIRFQLTYYKKEEIAQIVHFNNQDIPMEACMLAAHYAGKIPREALTFASEMKLEYEMSPTNWNEVANKIAKENDIDEFGMSGARLKVIIALGQGPIAANRLPNSVGVKIEELEKFLLPWLFEATDDQPPMIQVTSRGYSLTECGLDELNKRKIQNKGKDALVN